MSQDVVAELEARFSQLQEELKCSSTFEELDKVFFLRDMAVTDGVLPRLDRQVCRRIVDTFFAWNNFLHRLVMPNPHSMFETAEAGFFSEDEHEKMISTMSRILAHATRNNVLGVTQRTAEQTAFIDESLALWKELHPYFVSLSERIQKEWEKKATPQ